MDWMTPAELAAHLKVESKTLADWRCKGRGPSYFKSGGIVRYRQADVESWVREHTVDPSSDR
jgi:predicted site-specific integrase-resolvase